MKITKILLSLLFISFFVQTNINGENIINFSSVGMKQNGLNILQLKEEYSKFQTLNSLMQPTAVADSSVLYGIGGRKIQGNLYLRNENGKLVRMQAGLFGGQNVWWTKPQWEYIYEYDENERISSKEYYAYYLYPKGPQSKSEFKYDDKGNCVEEKQLDAVIKSVYDQFNQITEQTTTSHESVEKSLYTYDDKGRLVIYEYELVSSFYYSRYYRETYAYDNNNYVVESKYETLKDNEIISGKPTNYINTYDEGKLMSSLAVEEGAEKHVTEYTYDERGNKTSYVNYNINADAKEKIPMDRLLTEYDKGGNLVFYEQTIWSEEKKEWVGERVREPGAVNEGDIGRKEWVFDDENNMISGNYYVWNNNSTRDEGDAFVLHRSLVYYNSPKTPQGLENDLMSDIAVSIKNDHLIVDTPTSERIVLFSLMGQEVLQTEKMGDQISLSISDLPRGVYVVKGSSGWTRKINY